MISIVYLSAASETFDDADLTALLDRSRETNSAEGLTGLLLYQDGRFMQLLEGPSEAVIARYAAIAEDPRHSDVRMLSEQKIEKRKFPGWSMAFRSSGDHTVEMPGFSDFLDKGDRSDGSLQGELLTWFRNHPLSASAEVTTQSDSTSAARERVRIIDAAIASFRRGAFHDVSFDTVATEAGLDKAAVRQHFPSWDGLVIATIDRWNTERMRSVTSDGDLGGAVLFLRAIVRANIADPALMRLLTAMINIAATPEHPLAPLLQQRWHAFQNLVQDQLARDIHFGREPSTMEPARGAEQLVALYEGLQLQFMVRPGMNLLDAYDRAVTRLRDGWSRTYSPPVWDLDTVE
jgi:AcrR family transcriptional regulator